MCFTPSFILAIKSHSGPKQVGVLAASLTLHHPKVTLSINDVPQRPTQKRQQQNPEQR